MVNKRKQFLVGWFQIHITKHLHFDRTSLSIVTLFSLEYGHQAFSHYVDLNNQSENNATLNTESISWRDVICTAIYKTLKLLIASEQKIIWSRFCFWTVLINLFMAWPIWRLWRYSDLKNRWTILKIKHCFHHKLKPTDRQIPTSDDNWVVICHNDMFWVFSYLNRVKKKMNKNLAFRFVLSPCTVHKLEWCLSKNNTLYESRWQSCGQSCHDYNKCRYLCLLHQTDGVEYTCCTCRCCLP